VEWLRDEQPLFWINGKPGAGKSTLMKFITGHKHTLEVMSSKNSKLVIPISFFFHELGTSSERTFAGLLHALMNQLLTSMPELTTHVVKRSQGLKIRSGNTSSTEKACGLTESFRKLFSTFFEPSLPTLLFCALLMDSMSAKQKTSIQQYNFC
jgi:hypothetical protein